MAEDKCDNACERENAGKIECDSICTKQLTIFNDHGQSVATLIGLPDGVGLWMHGADPKQPTVAIFTLNGQQAIGLYESTSPKSAMPLALCLHNGRPQLQLLDANVGMESLRMVDLLDLIDRIGPALSSRAEAPPLTATPLPPQDAVT